MAVRSMTGYGRAEESAAAYGVTVEMKSVNNRFLEFQCRASQDQLYLEPLLRAEIGNYVARGSVTCHVHYQRHGSGANGVTLNADLFAAYVRLTQQAARAVGSDARVNVVDLLRVPDMVQDTRSVEAPETVAERILPVFRRAVAELTRMRDREGEALARDLEQRIDAFSPALDRVAALLPKRNSEVAAKLRARIEELLAGRAAAEDRLMTEVGILAEKLDVQEEIVRLRAHLQHFRETLAQPAAPGKKLGFLQQEMLREVNTLGNKSQYSDIQQICVGWKEDLEIIREQLQNVE